MLQALKILPIFHFLGCEISLLSLLSLLALWGNKNWPPRIKVKQIEISQNKTGIKGCKWSVWMSEVDWHYVFNIYICRYFAICRPTFYLRHRASFGNSSPLVDIVLSFYSGLILQIPRFLDTRHEILEAECFNDGGAYAEEETETELSGTEDITEHPCACGEDKNVIQPSWILFQNLLTKKSQVDVSSICLTGNVLLFVGIAARERFVHDGDLRRVERDHIALWSRPPSLCAQRGHD